MSDTPELTRYCLLQNAVMAHLIAGAPAANFESPGMRAIMKELDALTLRLVQRSRSAVNYHETKRGQAALADVAAIAPLLAVGEDGIPLLPQVDVVSKRWSPEQASGPMFPGMEPDSFVKSPVSTSGLAFLSPEHQPEPPKE